MKIALCFSRPTEPGIQMVVDVDRLPHDMKKTIMDKMAASRKDAPAWRLDLMNEGYYEIGLPSSFYEMEDLFRARVILPCHVDAFVTAYTAFMFALIICPDERMWTLMVWLYQMQQGAAQPVIYAALILAAIPTLLVFILAQNTILKGIVIPVEK